MAEKGWTTRVTTAAGAAAGAGAAQLGLGYGLGVVSWPVTPAADDSVWLGSLGWAGWITASATVFGAVIASRLGGPGAGRLRAPWRWALATSAGVGALVAVALIALPARSAVRVGSFSPQVTAGGYALVGLALGILAAYWAIASRPAAANLMATAAWLWALAITATVVELTAHRTSATYLTSWQFAAAGGRYGTIYWPSALLTLGAAALIGIVGAAPAVRRGELGTGAATSGAVGPLLVAASFLALAPRMPGTLGPLGSAYLIAPYAVLAGLGGSVLAVAVGQAVTNRRARRETGAVATDPAALPDGTDSPGTAGRPTPNGRAKLPSQPKSSVEPTKSKSSSGSPTATRPSAAPGPTGPATLGLATPGPASSGPASSGPASSGRARPTKAGPQRKAATELKDPKGTVTPPPASPAIAQINPKPRALG